MAAVWLVAVTAAPAFAAKKALHDIPLVWKPVKSLAKIGAVDLTGITSMTLEVRALTDVRKDPKRIGENREEEDERKILAVTTRDDVPAFCTKHLETILGDLGLRIGHGTDGSAGTDGAFLGGEVVQFFVTERNTYVGDVRLRLSLRRADGTVLWTGLVAGSEEHWGRSYKAENYYETLSDSLVVAAFNLLKEDGFRKALTATSAPASVNGGR
jgi:hypothetical protein